MSKLYVGILFLLIFVTGCEKANYENVVKDSSTDEAQYEDLLNTMEDINEKYNVKPNLNFRAPDPNWRQPALADAIAAAPAAATSFTGVGAIAAAVTVEV